MKKYKIYKKDNYIVVTDNTTSETFYGRAKDVMVDKNNTNRAAYRFFNILDLKEGIGLTIDQILKEDGSPYTSDEFDTFYRQNTGNFNGGGTAPVADLISTDPDNAIELGTDGKLWSGGGGGSVGTLQQVTDNGNTTTNAIEISNYIKASEFRSSADDITFADGIGNPIFYFSCTGANQANFSKQYLTSDRNYEYPDASGTIALASDVPTVDATPTDGSSNAVSSNGVFDGLALKQDTLTETNFGSFINGLTAKNTLVDADEVVSDDSADSNKAKKTSWLNVWLNYLKPKADALYAPLASVSTMVKLPADVTSTITTETVVSSFTYAVSANTTYIIRGRLGLGCNGTGGVNLGTKFPSGAVMSGNAIGRSSSSAAYTSAGFGTSGTLSGLLNSVNSQFGFAFVEIVLSVGSTAGNFEFIFASATAGQTSTVIAAGSYLEYIKL